MADPAEDPTREQVTREWRGVIDGSVSRHHAHRWAATWVEDADFDPRDVRILTGLQYMHGVDVVADANGGFGHSASGIEGRFIKDRAEIEADLQHWLKENALYDEDPSGFVNRKIAHALESLRRRDEADIGKDTPL
jgi:hypothetical protein